MAAAAASAVATQQNQRVARGWRRKPGGKGDSREGDPNYRAPTQNSAMHEKYMEDREREEATKWNDDKYEVPWGPIGRFLICIGVWKRPDALHITMENVREIVEKREKRNRGIVDPRTSTFISNWDLAILLLLLFTTLITPYEVVFLPSVKAITPLFVINRFVDGSFIFDMYVQFNLAFQAPPEKGGAWITDRRQIRNHYTAFWFWVDLVSVLPIWIVNFAMDDSALDADTPLALNLTGGDLGGELGSGEETEAAKSAAEMLQILRMVRLMRLIKITRIVKASRIFKRFEQNTEVSYAAIGMIKLMVFLFSWSHLQSCFWGLVPQLTGESYSWTDAFEEGLAEGQTASAWDLYVAGLYFSIMTVTSIGYGEMLPVNTSERMICSWLMLFSSIVWCYVMGQACSIAATMDPQAIEFKANMDSLNAFMRERGLPKTLKVALRAFFHNSKRLQQLDQESRLVGMMSPLMQSTVALQANKAWLDRIWYLKIAWYSPPRATESAKTCHSSFVAALAQKMVVLALIGQERVAGGILCIVNRGLAVKRWRMMSAGKVWGEDMILEQSYLIDYSEAVAMTYLEVYTLDKGTLDGVCKLFPECGKRIRLAARRMLIQRLVIQAMRRLAGLPPAKSFVNVSGPQTHALPPVSLEQKVDILIDSSSIASQKLMAAEGGGGDDDGPRIVEEVPAGGMTPLADVAAPAPAPTDRSGGGSSSGMDAASAASLERLYGMFNDVNSLQSAMGDELAKLSQHLGQRPKRTRGNTSFRQPQHQPRSAPGNTSLALRQIRENERDERSWADSARNFLPSWAQPHGGGPDMSA